jgi:ABC-type antimicrobial peptide transport system permease subunit
VAIVNEAFANKFLQGVDPLEQQVVMEQVIPDSPDTGPSIKWQIVGVTHSIKSREFREDYPEIDIPFWQSAYSTSFMAIRTEEPPATMLKTITAAISAVDPDAGFNDPVTMDQVHDEALGNERFPVILFASFAVLALLLAAIGIHGVTAFSVAQRSHEIALRMALGASRNRVVAMVLKEGVILASVGLAIGLGGAYFVGRAMQSTLYGVGTIDFLTISAVGLVLLIAALLACYLPAQKATRADPMVALRHE